MDCLRPSLAHLKPYDAVTPPLVDKLDANEFPLDLPEWFKKKLSLVWEKGIQSNRYPDGGHRSLKQAIADYAGVTAAQISVGNGSDELIRSLLIATCLEERGAILVPEPTFSMYGILAETLGVPVVKVPRHPETFALNTTACDQAFKQQMIRMVCLVSPNSPTGNSLTATEWAWLRQIPPETLVVIDEAYFEFSQTTAIAQLADHPNWVILRTFSKAFRLAAHRVGYAIGHPTLVRTLEALRLPYNLPSVSQWAVQLALEYAPDLLAGVAEIQQERDRMQTALSRFPDLKVWPSDANFLYFRVGQRDLGRLQAQLAQAGSAIRYTGGGLRLTIGTPEQNQRVLDRLQPLLLSSEVAVNV